MLKITATFLDEISWDIPHQNWGEKEWDRDFAAMKAAGINTVIMIRSGLARWMAWPCEYLHRSTGTAMPETDLLDIFLRLAEKYAGSALATGQARAAGDGGREGRQGADD